MKMSDNIIESLQALRDDIQELEGKLSSNTQKVQVALSNVSRLSRKESETMVALGGRNEDLFNYLLQITSNHEVQMQTALEGLLEQITSLIQEISE